MKRTLVVIVVLGLGLINAATAQTTYGLGATNLLQGPVAGSNTVVLAVSPATGTWSVTANDSWLHLDTAYQSGTGSTNVLFSYDANPGQTRTGTLTIAGQTLTIIQAGSTYVQAPEQFTTVASSDLNTPFGVAVDSAGNVYIADDDNSAIEEWTPTNNTVSTPVSSGLNTPYGVAVDASGNIYIADLDNNAVEEWMPATSTLITLLYSPSINPRGVALDSAGNVYIADSLGDAIEEWIVASNTLVTLVSSGLNTPCGVAVDAAGNVYIADTSNKAIKEWSPVSNTVTTLVSTGLRNPYGVAVDGSGNVFIADTGNNAVKEWSPASPTNVVTTLISSGLSGPFDVAVDGSDNLYIADNFNSAIEEVPCAFVDPTAVSEGSGAGSDNLPAVLPISANLTGPFLPTSDSSWLTINGATNGVVNFSFSTNSTGEAQTANITLLGEDIVVTQSAVPSVTPPTLFGSTLPGSGIFQFAFSNSDAGATFTVLTSTNLSLPLADWTVAGVPTNITPGLYVFSAATTSSPQCYYIVHSP